MTHSPKFPTRRDGHYHLPGGLKLPSVTEICGAVPKPFLVNWGAKVAAQAVLDDPYKYDTAAKAVTAVTGVKSDAGSRGRAVHELIEAWAADRDIFNRESTVMRLELQPELGGYERAFRQFLKAWRPEPVLTEATIWNATHGYAGRLDTISAIGAENWLLDFKTSKSIYAEYPLQITAYAMAEAYVLTVEGDTPQPLPEIHHTGIVLLRSNGTFDMRTVNDREHLFGVFLAVKQLWHYLNAQGG